MRLLLLPTVLAAAAASQHASRPWADSAPGAGGAFSRDGSLPAVEGAAACAARSAAAAAVAAEGGYVK